ncbi:hypothetical protein ACL03H_16450 [Saccharopolyspora sp. MS10]
MVSPLRVFASKPMTWPDSAWTVVMSACSTASAVDVLMFPNSRTAA